MSVLISVVHDTGNVPAGEIMEVGGSPSYEQNYVIIRNDDGQAIIRIPWHNILYIEEVRT